MKLLFTLLFLANFSFVSFSQEDLALNSQKHKTEIANKSIKVKLKNNSLRSYHLVIPNVLEIESVILGANTFCLGLGQEIYFVHEGKNYLLLTAQTEPSKQVYSLPKLIKKRKKALGLK